MNDLNELFELLAEEKRKKKAIEDKLKASIKEDLNGFFAQLGTTAPKEEIKEELLVEFTPPVVNNPPPTPAERAADTMASAKEYLGKDSFQQPEPNKVAPELTAITNKIKFLEQAISKIAAAGPGSGEVNLRYLDDIDRSTIFNGLYLRYNSTKKKFEFGDPGIAQSGDTYATVSYVDSFKDRIVSPDNSKITVIDNTGTTTSGGNIVPGHATDTLGTVTNPWKDIFVSQGSIYIADQDPATDAVSIKNTTKYLVVSRGGLKVTDNTGNYEIFQLDNTGKLILKSTQPLNTTTPALSLVGNLSGNQLGTTNTGVMLQMTGTQDNPSRMYVDGVGTGAYAAYIGRNARGTAASPTQTLSGDIIARFGGNAYATGLGLNSTSNVRIDMVAMSNQTSSDRGTRLEFWTTDIGSATPTRSAHIDSQGIDLSEAADTNAGVTFKDSSVLKYWPSVSGNSGKILRTDGTNFFWGSETVPSGQVLFKGNWNASTNSPTLSNSLPTGVATGWQYIVSVAGTQSITGSSVAFGVGDQVIYNGTTWIRIPAAQAQVQSNWTETNSSLASYIQNKPTLSTVATTGSYPDLLNKPTIPAAQVNSDWNATSGVSQILNKPSIPAVQIQADWTQTDNTLKDYIKNKPSIPAAGVTTVTPTTLDSTHHVAGSISGTTLTLTNDATVNNTPSTIVLRDSNGNINVTSWSVNTNLVSNNYSATATDYWIGVTAKGKTITLPATANTGRQYFIADCVHSGNPNINIAAASGATVSGNTGLSQQGQFVTATFIGGNWYCN